MRTCISALTEQTSHLSPFFFFFPPADPDDEDYVERGEFVALLCVVSISYTCTVLTAAQKPVYEGYGLCYCQ